MTELTALWLPILLSAVAVFILSSIIHMGPFWHRSDYPKLEKEDQVRDALRPLNLPAGDYMVPRPKDGAEMKSPEFREKLDAGPNLMLTVFPPGPYSMGGQLVQWFIYALAVSFFGAYVASAAVDSGAEYLRVFRFVGTTAFLGYSMALVQLSIWYKRSWSITWKGFLDGLIYALVTAGVFGWLWPR